MRIQFKKSESKPSILTCIRDDGSTTWVKIHPGIEAHDLGHYAVETLLEFEHAFYGMVAKGTNIEDFELPRNKRPEQVIPKNLHPQALISEHLVNLLMTKAQSDSHDFDILGSLKTILDQNQLPFPQNLTEEKMNQIWISFTELDEQWKRLAFEGIMELEF